MDRCKQTSNLIVLRFYTYHFPVSQNQRNGEARVSQVPSFKTFYSSFTLDREKSQDTLQNPTLKLVLQLKIEKSSKIQHSEKTSVL